MIYPPLERATPGAPAPFPAAAPRVLVIEDHAVSREPLLRVLRLCGFDAVGAGNGADGLAAVAAAPADLILLDLMMPKMDGVMFLEALRGRPDGRAVPVLLLTAIPSGSLLARAKELGVSAVLRKAGFDLDELIAMIRAHLPPGRASAEAPAAAATSGGAAA